MFTWQRTNRIHNQLSGPVVSDVATTIHAHQISTNLGWVTLQICYKISRRTISKHVVMLKHQ